MPTSGWLTKQHGLSADNLLAAEVVLANGVTVSFNREFTRTAPDGVTPFIAGLSATSYVNFMA